MGKIKQTETQIKQTTPKVWELLLTVSQAGLAAVAFLVESKYSPAIKVMAVIVGAQAIVTGIKKFMK